jgi:hypothetical protein
VEAYEYKSGRSYVLMRSGKRLEVLSVPFVPNGFLRVEEVRATAAFMRRKEIA